MTGKKSSIIFLRIFSIIFAILSFCILCVNSTNPWIIRPVEVASKTVFPADCVDGDGNARSHLQNWTSSSGSCDRRVCYEGALETLKWQINYDCVDEYEFPDTVNCEFVSDSTLTFPYCCPYLVCNNESATTTTLAPCSDRSPQTACEFWKNKTNCVDSIDSLLTVLYNFTVENCALTCGFCAP